VASQTSLNNNAAENPPQGDLVPPQQQRDTKRNARRTLSVNEDDGSSSHYVLTDQIGHLLRRAHQRATGIFLSNMASASLTPTQFAALVMIRDEGPVSQNHLGRMIAMDPATTQGVVSRLQERALIERVPDETDRRRMALTVSAAGRALTDGLIDTAQEISAQTLAPLSAAEVKSLLSALKKIG